MNKEKFCQNFRPRKLRFEEKNEDEKLYENSVKKVRRQIKEENLREENEDEDMKVHQKGNEEDVHKRRLNEETIERRRRIRQRLQEKNTTEWRYYR